MSAVAARLRSRRRIRPEIFWLTKLCPTAFWWKLGLSAVLVLLGGVFAGLTLGLMGLDLVNLQGEQEHYPFALLPMIVARSS